MLMPDRESFYAETLAALQLMPQAGPAFYLAGKGWGSEIAIEGKVKDREKYDIQLPYRPHSDFELYAVGDDFDYTPAFKSRFGAQETRPVSRTKALTNLPPNLLRNTAETVQLGVMSILIPQLELLFLDKHHSSEIVPRTVNDTAVRDADCIAICYDLDRKKLHQYEDDYVLKPQHEALEQSKLYAHKNQPVALIRNLNRLCDEGKSIDKAIATLNDEMARRISSLGVYSGIRIPSYITLTAPDIVASGGDIMLTRSYLDRLSKSIDDYYATRVINDARAHQHLDAALDFAQQQRKQLMQGEGAAKRADWSSGRVKRDIMRPDSTGWGKGKTETQ